MNAAPSRGFHFKLVSTSLAEPVRKAGRPKVKKAKDTVLQNTVEVEGINLVVAKGVFMKDVRIIAGRDTRTILRDAKRLSVQYGEDEWKREKKSGIIKTEYFRYEIHRYEYDGT